MTEFNDNNTDTKDVTLLVNETMSKYPDRRTTKEYAQIKNAVANIFDLPYIKNVENKTALAYKLYKYIIENSRYDPEIMQEKRQDSPVEIQFREIYRCLCEHRSVCTGDACALALLLRTAGIPSTHIGIDNKPDASGARAKGGSHAVVRLELDGKELYCDPTLFRQITALNHTPLTPELFAFPAEVFFGKFYKDKEIVFVHGPHSLEIMYLSIMY